MPRILICTAVLLFTLGFLAAPAAAQCVDGNISAQLETGGPFDGLYKYTVVINWSTPQGLSHATLDCNFGACAAEACAADWFFATPAGVGSGGEPGNCDFDFEGEFNCSGDPSIGLTDPVIKWDALETDGCEAANTGTAVLCFYTSVPPVQHITPITLVKNGQNVCNGSLTGDCPLPCATPTDETSWGRIKTLFDMHDH